MLPRQRTTRIHVQPRRKWPVSRVLVAHLLTSLRRKRTAPSLYNERRDLTVMNVLILEKGDDEAKFG